MKENVYKNLTIINFKLTLNKLYRQRYKCLHTSLHIAHLRKLSLKCVC